MKWKALWMSFVVAIVLFGLLNRTTIDFYDNAKRLMMLYQSCILPREFYTEDRKQLWKRKREKKSEKEWSVTQQIKTSLNICDSCLCVCLCVVVCVGGCVWEGGLLLRKKV